MSEMTLMQRRCKAFATPLRHVAASATAVISALKMGDQVTPTHARRLGFKAVPPVNN